MALAPREPDYVYQVRILWSDIVPDQCVILSALKYSLGSPCPSLSLWYSFKVWYSFEVGGVCWAESASLDCKGLIRALLWS